MRVLFDITHPAHVHFYRYMIEELDAGGHAWKIASRDKDVTNDLLHGLGLEHTSVSRAGAGSLALARELVERDAALWRLGREFEPDIILTRSPAGTHAGRLLGIPTVFDTDNGRSAGIHYWASAPIATAITTPDCFPDDLGDKQIRYPSYKALAFLHPSRFAPDSGVRARLGLGAGERYHLLRLVAMGASHDRGESGMPVELVRETVARLGARGRVFVSSESPLPEDLAAMALPTSSDDFLNVVAGASLCIGDSGSVVQEAALLGVPAIFVSTFARRTAPINELEDRFELVRSFRPDQARECLSAIDEIAGQGEGLYRERLQRMLEVKVDLTTWYLEMIESFLDARRLGHATGHPGAIDR